MCSVAGESPNTPKGACSIRAALETFERRSCPLCSSKHEAQLVIELDLVLASMYQRMAHPFVPCMRSILLTARDTGQVDVASSKTILKCIPESITAETAQEQRSLALQNNKPPISH